MYLNVSLIKILLFFSFASHEFWGTSIVLGAIVTLLSFFLITQIIVFDLALLGYSLTKDSVWGVEKLHIKSIKDIESITVRFLVQI